MDVQGTNRAKPEHRFSHTNTMLDSSITCDEWIVWVKNANSGLPFATSYHQSYQVCRFPAFHFLLNPFSHFGIPPFLFPLSSSFDSSALSFSVLTQIPRSSSSPAPLT